MKLLALDLDGTLLRHDKVVDPRDIAAIHRAREAGVRVTIVTGRLRTGSLYAASATGIEGMIACCEGSHVVDVTGRETHVHHPIDPRQVALVRAIYEEHGLTTFVFDRDAIHHDVAGEPYAAYVSTWSPDMRLVEEHHLKWSTDPLAAVGIGDEDRVSRAALALQAHAGDLFSVSFGVWNFAGTHAVLVRKKGPTKGTALAALCELAGCTLADAVAIGDWINDVPMFEVAGRSFVMGGAPPHVAAKASDRLSAEQGTGGGIAEAIEKALG